MKNDVIWEENKAKTYKNDTACLDELYKFMCLATPKQEN